jgi:hypothetical protein
MVRGTRDKVAGLIEFQVLETPFPKLLTYCMTDGFIHVRFYHDGAHAEELIHLT